MTLPKLLDKLEEATTVAQKSKVRNKVLKNVSPIICSFPKYSDGERDNLLRWYEIDSDYFTTNKLPYGQCDEEKLLNLLYFFVRNKNHKIESFISYLENNNVDIGTDHMGQIYNIMTGINPEDCSCGSGIKLKYKNFKDGFNKSCYKGCSHANKLREETCIEKYGTSHVSKVGDFKEKAKQTCIEKFGHDNAMKSDEIKNKISSRNLEKYGVYFTSKLNSVKDKVRETNNERYGGNSPMSSNEIRKKSRRTCVERYGVENVSQSEEIKDRIKKTNLEKYGTEYANQSEEVKKKIEETNVDRYGNKCSLVNEDVKRKTVNTIIERYGVDNPMKNDDVRKRASQTYENKTGYSNPLSNPEVRDAIKLAIYNDNNVYHHKHIHLGKDVIDKLNDIEWIICELKTKTVSQISDELNCCETTIYKRIKNNNILFGSRSLAENVIWTFLKDTCEVICNDRTCISPLELDFYLPEYNLAIEHNGLYWHSDIFKDKDYHLNKYNLCKQKGIRLISINEDEWNERSDIIKSKILSIIGKASKGLPARKLSVKEITSREGNDFCEQYHVQGSTSSVIYSVGAFDNDDLVGVMLFSKQRTTGDIELIRFCHDGKTHSGLFSKLLKYSMSNQKSWNKIISFADLRYSEGDLYEKTGFIREKIVGPDYKYVKNNKTFHKSNFTKDRIMSKFNLTEEEVKDKTERELMEEYGFCRIYDIGKIKYVMNIG